MVGRDAVKCSIMAMEKRGIGLTSALALGVGIACGGYFIGSGIKNRNQESNAVSVKGLSEREVPASVAIWTVSYSATANDLAAVNDKLSANTAAVRTFLTSSGFAAEDIAVQPATVVDLTLQQRDKDHPPPAERFSASQAVLLRTAKVDAVKPAVAVVSRLLSEGVMLSGSNEPNYIFDKINEIKPGMIQEATKNARVAAQQFATDSQVALGKLRNASQGWFQVNDRDGATPERKIVRVVVDVVYEVD